MALPDTGAEMSVLGEEFAYSMGVSVEKMQHTDTVVMTADGLPMDIVGETEITVHYRGKEVTETVVVSSECTGVILSWQVSEALGIVQYDEQIRDPPQATSKIHKMTTPKPSQDKKSDDKPSKKTKMMMVKERDQ